MPMIDEPEDNINDQIILVRLPRSQYLVLRKMIDDQQTAEGFSKWIKSKYGLLIWVLGGLLTMAGLYEFFKRLQ